ncbi:Os01g0243800, partial [Oryza sativa Japonica Group]
IVHVTANILWKALSSKVAIVIDKTSGRLMNFIHLMGPPRSGIG